jgi:transcriptional regulator with XRE-family HTH domain
MNADLGEFLRARRARVRPQEAGLSAAGRRRVPGLRRDELAQLAGVSVEYYTRIEQGRGPNISDEVLDALGRVLRLDPTERAHLHNLARRRRLRGTRVPVGRQVPAETRMLLDALDTVPPGAIPVTGRWRPSSASCRSRMRHSAGCGPRTQSGRKRPGAN